MDNYFSLKTSVTPNKMDNNTLCVTVTLVFMQKSLGNVFDSSTKSLEDSGKVITFAGRTVKRNDNNEAKS